MQYYGREKKTRKHAKNKTKTHERHTKNKKFEEIHTQK